MDDKKNVLYIILAVIIVGLLGWWLVSSPRTPEEKASTEAPAPALAPALQLTEAEKKGDVTDKKAEILARVRSGTPLTPEDKAEIGGIMLTKAHVYQFSEEERVDIFAALQAE